MPVSQNDNPKPRGPAEWLDEAAELTRPESALALDESRLPALLAAGCFVIERRHRTEWQNSSIEWGADVYDSDLHYQGTVEFGTDIATIGESAGISCQRAKRNGIGYLFALDSRFSAMLAQEHAAKHHRDDELKNNQPAIDPHSPNGLTFLVQGSARDPYTVIFDREGCNVTARCTCPAGRFRCLCKHRLALIMGDVTALVSDNITDTEKLNAMLLDSDVQEGYRQFLSQQQLERAGELTIKQWSAAKKALAQAFAD